MTLPVLYHFLPDKSWLPLHRGSGKFFHNLTSHIQYLHQSGHKNYTSAKKFETHLKKKSPFLGENTQILTPSFSLAPSIHYMHILLTTCTTETEHKAHIRNVCALGLEYGKYSPCFLLSIKSSHTEHMQNLGTPLIIPAYLK